MQLVLARITVPPAQAPALHAALAGCFALFRAEEGCLYYSVAMEDAAAGVLIAVEKWRDEVCRAAHGANPALHAAVGPYAADMQVEMEVLMLPDAA